MGQNFNLITQHRDYDLSNNLRFDEIEKLREHYSSSFFSEEEDYIEITFEVVEKILSENKLSEEIKKVIKRSLEISKEKGLEYIAFEYF